VSVVVSSPLRPVPTHPHPPPSSRVVRSTSHTHHINQSHTDRVDAIHARDGPRGTTPPFMTRPHGPRDRGRRVSIKSTSDAPPRVPSTSDDPTTSPFHE